MASKMQQTGLQKLMNAEVDMDTHTIRCIFTRASTHVFSQAHDFFNDLVSPVGNNGDALVTDGGQLDTPVIGADSTFDAADEVILSVDAGAALNQLHIYRDTGVASTSPLLAFIDGFTITPNGSNITIQWAGAPNFIWKLGAD